jgi:hypothetical protein
VPSTCRSRAPISTPTRTGPARAERHLGGALRSRAAAHNSARTLRSSAHSRRSAHRRSDRQRTVRATGRRRRTRSCRVRGLRTRSKRPRRPSLPSAVSQTRGHGGPARWCNFVTSNRVVNLGLEGGRRQARDLGRVDGLNSSSATRFGQHEWSPGSANGTSLREPGRAGRQCLGSRLATPARRSPPYLQRVAAALGLTLRVELSTD